MYKKKKGVNDFFFLTSALRGFPAIKSQVYVNVFLLVLLILHLVLTNFYSNRSLHRHFVQYDGHNNLAALFFNKKIFVRCLIRFLAGALGFIA